MPDFEAWPKIPRYKGLNVVITEKIDGTNGCIIVENIAGYPVLTGMQSRKRFVDRYSDNAGFAHWVMNNNHWLVNVLGEGRHFGEWAGPGIQSNPMKLPEKRFFLFNTSRWAELESPSSQLTVVPVLYQGEWEPDVVTDAMSHLETLDYKAEGIVMYFPEMRASMKYTFEHREGKWRG